MKKILLAVMMLVCTPAFAQNDKIVRVSELPYYEAQYGAKGWEERGPEYRRWLAPSVRVTAYGGGGGSGTICYYDPVDNWAYIISCGHLYSNGRKSWAEYQKRPVYKKILVYYHNEKKLDKPQEYKGETLCHVVTDSANHDVSLIRFKPDWIPWVNAIAPLDYKLEKGKYYHSTGCDGLNEVAHYLVKYQGQRVSNGQVECITVENSPRKGRSGGGTMNDEYQLVFLCSRGNGTNGYWTSLQQIHKFLKDEGFEFVLDGSVARQIPIRDRANPGTQFPKDYIPLPGNR